MKVNGHFNVGSTSVVPLLAQHLLKIQVDSRRKNIVVTRPGVDKVKPKVWFKYSL